AAAQPTGTSVDQRDVRQQLLAYPRVDAVGADEQVTGCRGAVGEVRLDLAGGPHLVVRELAVEVHDAVESVEQDLPQGQPVHRPAGPGKHLGVAVRETLGAHLHERCAVDPQHAHTGARLAAGRLEP